MVVSRKEKGRHEGETKRKRLNCKRGTRNGARVRVNSWNRDNGAVKALVFAVLHRKALKWNEFYRWKPPPTTSTKGSSCCGGVVIGPLVRVGAERSVLAEAAAAVSPQESSTSKDSESIWKIRTQRGNGVNTSSSKTPASSTSPTETRWTPSATAAFFFFLATFHIDIYIISYIKVKLIKKWTNWND